MQINEFVEVYRGVAALYPGRMQTDKETMDSWFRVLYDIPIEYIQKAVMNLSDNTDVDVRYPPNALQIRRIARQLSGTTDFNVAVVTERESNEEDLLRKRMFDLEAAFYTEGELDPVAWQDLAVEFRHDRRNHAANHAEEVLARLAGLAA